MTTDRLQILYIEDNIADLKLLENQLRKEDTNPITLAHASTLQAGLGLLAEKSFALVLLDLSLPDAHHLEGLEKLKETYPFLPVVVLTGNTDKNMGVEAIKYGAQDYLVKGEFQPNLLLKVCQYATERAKINAQLSKALSRVEGLNLELGETVEALRKEKLLVEQKNQQINSYINMIVHDLKNPIGAINAITDLLLKDSGQLSEDLKKYLQQIKRSSSSMLDNILAIIETTQANEGELKLDLIADSPYYTLNAAIDKFVVSAIQKNVIIDIKYKKDMPYVIFEKRSLGNSLAILLETLIKHVAPNSRITISSEVSSNGFLTVSLTTRALAGESEEWKQVAYALQEANTPHMAEDVLTTFSLSIAKKVMAMMGGKLGITQAEGSSQAELWVAMQLAGQEVA